MNIAKTILILVVVIILAVGLGFGIYFLVNKPSESSASVYNSYKQLVESEEYKTYISKVNDDPNNELLTFGNNIDENYKFTNSFYNAEQLIFDTLAVDLYFANGGDGSLRNQIVQQITSFKNALTEVNRSIRLFETNKELYADKVNDITSAEYAELVAQFSYIQKNVALQAKYLANINSSMFEYVKSTVYNNSINSSLKYSLLDCLFNQVELVNLSWDNLEIKSTDTSSEQSRKIANHRILQEDTDKIYKVYKQEETTNFENVSIENSTAYKFVVAYTNLDKETFFENIDKSNYYKGLTAQQQSEVAPVYDFIGFSKGGA